MKVLLFVLIVVAVTAAPQPDIDDKIYKFLKGFLEGLNERGDINKLLACVEGIDKIIEDIIEAFKLIATKKTENIIIGITKLLDAVKTLMHKFQPCAEGFEQLKILIESLKKIDIVKIVIKIITNPAPYIENVMKAIDAFKTGDFYNAGKGIGNVLYLLFIAAKPAGELDRIAPEDVLAIIESFFDGMNTGGNLTNFATCSKKFSTVYIYVIELINFIKEGKWDLPNILDFVKKVTKTIKSIVTSLIPCKDITIDFLILWNVLKSIEMKAFFNKLIEKLFGIMHIINVAIEDYSKGNYSEFGKGIGKIIYIILLQA